MWPGRGQAPGAPLTKTICPNKTIPGRIYNILDKPTDRTYNKNMKYEWNEYKKEANFEKHGVDFNEIGNFEWDSAIETIDDRKDYGEQRWIAVGRILNRIYVLIYTIRNKNIRVISLRKANTRERNYYETQT